MSVSGRLNTLQAAPVAGALSGISQVLAEQPFDTIKIRMQSTLDIRFNSMSTPTLILKRTLVDEGWGALMQGLAPRIAFYGVVKLSLFSLYERFHQSLTNPTMAGAVAGGLNTVVSCPQDVLKSRLQMQVRSGGGGGIKAALKDCMAGGRGVAGLYRGWGPLVARDTIGYGLFFTMFHYAKRTEGVPVWLAGGASGLSFYLSTLPIDRIKTIVMTQDTRKPKYSGALAAYRDVVRTQGYSGLYRGCLPTLLRTFVGQSVALTVYDKTTSLLRDHEP